MRRLVAQFHELVGSPADVAHLANGELWHEAGSVTGELADQPARIARGHIRPRRPAGSIAVLKPRCQPWRQRVPGQPDGTVGDGSRCTRLSAHDGTLHGREALEPGAFAPKCGTPVPSAVAVCGPR